MFDCFLRQSFQARAFQHDLFAEIHVGFVYELACHSSTVPVIRKSSFRCSFIVVVFLSICSLLNLLLSQIFQAVAIINREIWKVIFC